jgi:hypothetical protein
MEAAQQPIAERRARPGDVGYAGADDGRERAKLAQERVAARARAQMITETGGLAPVERAEDGGRRELIERVAWVKVHAARYAWSPRSDHRRRAGHA